MSTCADWLLHTHQWQCSISVEQHTLRVLQFSAHANPFFLVGSAATCKPCESCEWQQQNSPNVGDGQYGSVMVVHGSSGGYPSTHCLADVVAASVVVGVVGAKK